ncbi:MAG: hypothetical protein GWM98_02480 [Nitrospinaceae bacterium]|nr:hypothetical protein [Nitrospinaceae bacterium]NIR53571.1 hypothetical protein [Nitrospinaceae bacterium]NIS83972.1 hypothetical protein [Nitrospinaceae bacterium]NIT80781.1 hypothetical protein [Nitrospinaceae bacterium]NIU43087.1 hypothetical protein [Nitrospinaceae bacterium]
MVLLLVFEGCYQKKVEEAFDGDFSSEENNRVISEYCQSCHLHRNFSPADHVEEKTLLYNRKVFRLATECRTCHYLEKQMKLNDFIRHTRRPKEANTGQYREFELGVLKEQREK